jgi:hypothetical protein
MQLLYLAALKAPLLLQEGLDDRTASGAYAVTADVVEAALSAQRREDQVASKRAAAAAANGCVV